MKKIFGKVVMSQRELDREIENAQLRGRRQAQRKPSEQQKDIMIRYGFFPVTDDFWKAIGMPMLIGQGFDWALYEPEGGNQKFMPFHGWYFVDKKSTEIYYEARNAKKRLKRDF